MKPAKEAQDISQKDFRIFESTPGKRVVFLPDSPQFTIVAISNDMCRFVNRTREEVVGRSVFEAFPANPNDSKFTGHKNLRASLDHVVQHRADHQMELQRYDVAVEGGSFKEIYWQNTSTPVLDDAGEVAYIIHAAEDITEKIKERELQKRLPGLEQAYSLFMQAPFAIQIFTGPDLVIDLANPPTLELWGRAEDVTGKRFLEVLPELAGQGYDVMMQEVMQSGTSRFFYEVPLALNRQGKGPVGYFNFVYQPYYKKGASKAESVLAIAHEVTQQVSARKSIQESEARFQAVVHQTPAPTMVLRGDAFRIEHINGPMLEMMGRGEEVTGQPFLQVMPELEGQYAWQQVQRVYREGISFHQNELPVSHKRNGVLQDFYYNVAYRPFVEDGRITGVIQIAIDVTEQVAVQKKLKESQWQLAAIFEQSPAAIAIIGKNRLEIQQANPFYCSIVGRKREELLGKPLLEALPEVAGQGFDDLMYGVIESGAAVTAAEMPAQLLRQGHIEQIYVDFSYNPVREEDGSVSGVFLVATDITKQVLSRRALEESESRLRNVIDTTPVGTAILTGPEMKVEIANEVILKFWQRDKSVIGKPLTEALPELIGQPFPELLAEVYTTGITHVDQEALAYLLTAQEKLEPYYFNYSYTALREAGGAVYGVLIMAIDVTETVLARRKIEEQAAALQSAIEIAELGTWKLDAKSGIIHFSEKLTAMFGTSQFSFSAEEALRFVAEADREEVARAYGDAMKPELGGRYDKEFRIINAATGKTHVLRALGQARFDAAGTLVSMEGTSQDVTLQRELQSALETEVQERTSELAKANETLHDINTELQRSNHHLEEFAHAASHDLKEPVRKITFFTNQLKAQLRTHLTEAEIRFFDRIENATERMGSLIDDLLLYSHVSQRPHEKEPVDLGEKVQRVLEDLELNIQDKAAVVHVAPLPVVKGYGRQLQQLFQNLISNALKYSKANVPPHVTITAGQQQHDGKAYHVIHVTDNGIGFEQGYEEKIFQMFARLHGKSEYSGTGIGLSIVKKVVENHSGFIRVESVVGEGSVFKVYLPV